MQSHSQLPLETPVANPEKLIRKEKAYREGSSVVELGISDYFPSPSIETPFFYSHVHVIPSAVVSRTLAFGSVPVEFSPPGLGLEGEILVTPLSPEVVPRHRPRTTEYLPTPRFTTPPLITVVATTERETYVDSIPVAFFLNPPLFPFPPGSLVPVSPIRTPSPPSSPPPNIPMAGANPPSNRMDSIVVARYDPLVLPQPLNPLPTKDYLKYMPKFTREEDITVEEHLVAFYSYVDNMNIENEDVWMRVFVQSLEGEARKWFRGLTPGSIVGIEAFDNDFLRQWGDKKDLMYYMTEFGSLKRMEGESISDFSKRFNKMYNNISAEIKTLEATAKITYASDFDPNFCLLIRERRATSSTNMQDASLEV